MLRVIRWSATGLIVIVAACWAIVWMARADPGSRAAMLIRSLTTPPEQTQTAAIGGAFDLVDASGKPVTDRSFRGRWMLVYFGYAYCPDICPTMLQTISTALDQLGTKAAQVAPVFITVDPERDTPAAIGQYVALFDQRLIGLTGTQAQISEAESAYRVSSRRVSLKGDGAYMVDHSSYAYLMDPKGNLAALFKADVSASDMAGSVIAAMQEAK